MPIVRPFTALFASLALCACSSSHPVAVVNAPARQANEPRRVFRFDFVVTTLDVGKPPVSSSYTLNLESRMTGEFHVGSNIALSPNGGARQDVGLKLSCVYFVVGDDLILRGQTEMSAVDDAPGIHKIMTSGQTFVVPGSAPTLVSSVEEPTTHRRYQVTVAATKVL